MTNLPSVQDTINTFVTDHSMGPTTHRTHRNTLMRLQRYMHAGRCVDPGLAPGVVDEGCGAGFRCKKQTSIASLEFSTAS